jgi:hypothetical protein
MGSEYCCGREYDGAGGIVERLARGRKKNALLGKGGF